MTRNALPQNYIVNQGTLLDDFETAGSYTGVYGCTVAANTTEYKTGSKSLKVTGNVGVGCSFDKVINANLSTDCKNMGIWIYFHSDPATTLAYAIIFLSSTADFSKHFYKAISLTTNPELKIGWNWIPLYGIGSGVAWTNVGSDSWDSPRIRMRISINSKAGQQAIMSFDSWYVGIKYRPKALIMFDDCTLSSYTEGFSYMQTKGIKGTSYINSAVINSTQEAQLVEMYNAGWAIGNHSSTHEDFGALSQAVIEERLQACTDWLLAHGFNRGAYHVAYPFGTQNAAVLAAMAKLGMKTGRSVTAYYQRTPPQNKYILGSSSIGESTRSLATAKGYVDSAIAAGHSMFFLFHHLAVSAASATWAIADFHTFIDYLIERGVECVTIDEWYEGLTNPRYRSVPLSRATV